MGVIVNGKEYTFNLDVRLGILELMDRIEDLQIKHLKMIVKELLRPIPTSKELFNVKRSDMNKIMEAFTEEMKKESAEFKKKLSS